MAAAPQTWCAMLNFKLPLACNATKNHRVFVEKRITRRSTRTPSSRLRLLPVAG